VGWFVFTEEPTVPMLAGAALIISAGLFIIWRERRLGIERARARRSAAAGGQPGG
jgi:drug/metabolite transporter (DMT)-like permease